MRSRLAAIAGSSYRAVTGFGCETPRRGLVAVPKGRAADPEVLGEERESEVKPAVFSGEPEKTREVYEPDPKTALKRDVEHELPMPRGDSEPFVQPRPPHSTSPKLQSTPVHDPVEPIYQQKQKKASATPVENVSCAGLDGSPWPEGDGENQSQGKRGEADEDDREYYKHHKASPLSEIKFADTRKPITRATDGTADSAEYGRGPGVVGWRPEQLDTAEEALMRAARIWKESAMTGVPDAPQSRVLRALRGEV
ncbi:uncharacterized protein LOC115750204 [Rhodamnia argentea]|uniref:Uncharacterized protein LOC115750204 n=1 Tax=Rhodamnia argentea TaxID=178133 RepID=A0A8B8Q817_9MYRT|nr:uncharacterized protein LOC115750204 [Rhodamnia argentea]